MEHALAYHRAMVVKTSSWAEEKKVLLQKWGKVNYNYPKKQYDTLMACGDLGRRPGSGRPRLHDDALVVDAIRQARSNVPGNTPHRLSAGKMAGVIAGKVGTGSPSLSKSTILRVKKRLGYQRIKRRKKPLVDVTARKKRLDFATDHDGFDFTNWLVLIFNGAGEVVSCLSDTSPKLLTT